MSKKQITIVGSYNVGLFLKGDSLPGMGETLMGNQFYESGGGKGSNQAIAAHKMGAETLFMGRIGQDKYGSDAISFYQKLGMSTRELRVDDRTHTGISVILVDKQGRNSIMVVPGTNYLLDENDMEAAFDTFAASGIVGFQLENRLETVCQGIRCAHRAGAQVLLDPAPAVPLPEDIYPCLTYIKPNEVEAATISGIPVHDVASARKAGEWFLSKGVGNALITLGSGGAVLVTPQGWQAFSVPKLDAPVLDTTGAGDCFSGVFMACLAEGLPAERAVQLAICASALSVTRLGVVEALPDREEVLAFDSKAWGDQA